MMQLMMGDPLRSVSEGAHPSFLRREVACIVLHLDNYETYHIKGYTSMGTQHRSHGSNLHPQSPLRRVQR
jgi:hypothetical protein